MKKFLREWLGIPDPSKYVSIDALRLEVGTAIRHAFDPVDNIHHSPPRKSYLVRLDGIVSSHVSNITYQSTKEAVSAIIKPESFIDAVVERIKNKQL